MSVPCVRIELTYADGSRNIAEGSQAQSIVDWMNACQKYVFDSEQLFEHLRINAPYLQFIPGGKPPLTTGTDSEPALRGGEESGL